MELKLRARKYFKQARIFISSVVVFGFFAAGFGVNNCAAEEENSKEVKTIADYIKQEEKALNEKISKYLKDAERELYKNNFSLARSYIEKASEIKESEREKIREKARELAEKEVYQKRERDELNKLANQASVTGGVNLPGKKTTKSIRDKREEAQALLENITSAEEAFRETKRVESKTREQKRQEEKRAEKEREIRIQTEKMEKYLAEAQKFLEKNEFSNARECVEKALEIKDGSQKILKKEGNKAGKTRIAREKEQAARRAEEEKKQARREKKIAGFLEQSAKALKTNKFDRARDYAKKVFSESAENTDAKEMLERIATAEQAREEKEKEIKAAARRAEEEKESVRREKKIAGFLEQSAKALKTNKFDRARDYAKKVFSESAENTDAKEMLERIATAEQAREEKEKEIKAAARRAEGEKERVRREKKVAEFLKQAVKALDSNNFGNAKKYAGKAVSADEESADAKEMLIQVSEAEKIYEENKKREKEDLLRRRREKVRAERDVKTTKYLRDAEDALRANKFGRALNCAEKAYEVDPNNVFVRDILNQISREETDYKKQKKQKTVKKEKPERKKAPAPEKDKKIETKKDVSGKLGRPRRRFASADQATRGVTEEEKTKRPPRDKKAAEEDIRREKIAKLLNQAESALKENDFKKAQSCAEKVLKADKNNVSAREMTVKISKTESDQRKKEVIAANEAAARARADAVREKRDRDEKEKLKSQETKLKKHIDEAKKHLEKKDFSNARRYAYKAKDIDPTDSVTALLIADIDKGEMFGIKAKEALERASETEEALKEFSARKEDAFTKDDEGKEWYEYVTDIFKKRVYELGKVHEGRVYTIDECVQLALRRSQRIKVADKQVTLAKKRVWETRRELLPSVTTRIERSTGKIGTAAGPRHYQGEKYQVELKHNVFDGMGTWFTVRQSQTNLDVVKLEREKVKNEIVGETKTSYYNLDKAVKAFAIQEMYKERINNYYRIAEESFKQELIPEMERLKVKGQNMQANFQYDSSKEDITLAETILYQAMNVEPEYPINIQPITPPEDTLTIGLENCYRLAFANRPDFKIKEKMIEYYDFDRKISKAKGWPKIDFQGSFGNAVETYQPTTDNEEERGLSPEWYAGVQASVPIWGNTLEYSYVREKWAPVVSSYHGTESVTNYLSIKFLDDMAYFTNLAESRAGFESAKYEYLKYKKDLIVEVKETYFKYRKALLQMDVAKAQVEHQKMFVGVLEERRLFGEMELSKIIEEYEKFSEHQYGLIQGHANYFISLAELNKAIGVPDYFDPGHEDQEYGVWDAEIILNKPSQEEIIMGIENPVVSEEVLPDGVIGGGK